MTRKQVTAIVAPYSWNAALVPLTMTALFCIYKDLDVKLNLFIAIILSGVLGQSLTNIINCYSDFKSGLDNSNTIFNTEGSILVHDKVREKEVVLLGFGVAFLLAIPIMYLVSLKGLNILIVALIGFFLGFIYSAGPFPISTTPIGEVYSGIIDGFYLSFFSYYIYTGSISYELFWVALPTVLWVTTMTFTNSICDMEKDRELRTTLALFLGKKKSITLLKIIYISMFLCQFLNIYLELVPFTTMLTIFAIPIIIKNLNSINTENATERNKFMIMEKSCSCGEIFFYIYFLALITSIFVERV